MSYDMNAIRENWRTLEKTCRLTLPEGCEWEQFDGEWWLRVAAGRGASFPVSLLPPIAVAYLGVIFFEQVGKWPNRLVCQGMPTYRCVYRASVDFVYKYLAPNGDWVREECCAQFLTDTAAFVALLPVLAEEKRGEPMKETEEVLLRHRIRERRSDALGFVTDVETLLDMLKDRDRKAAP